MAVPIGGTLAFLMALATLPVGSPVGSPSVMTITCGHDGKGSCLLGRFCSTVGFRSGALSSACFVSLVQPQLSDAGTAAGLLLCD